MKSTVLNENFILCLFETISNLSFFFRYKDLNKHRIKKKKRNCMYYNPFLKGLFFSRYFSETKDIMST